jgi:uncharacterized membrane protein
MLAVLLVVLVVVIVICAAVGCVLAKERIDTVVGSDIHTPRIARPQREGVVVLGMAVRLALCVLDDLVRRYG